MIRMNIEASTIFFRNSLIRINKDKIAGRRFLKFSLDPTISEPTLSKLSLLSLSSNADNADSLLIFLSALEVVASLPTTLFSILQALYTLPDVFLKAII